MEDRNLEQLELNVMKKITVRLDHLTATACSLNYFFFPAVLAWWFYSLLPCLLNYFLICFLLTAMIHFTAFPMIGKLYFIYQTGQVHVCQKLNSKLMIFTVYIYFPLISCKTTRIYKIISFICNSTSFKAKLK